MTNRSKKRSKRNQSKSRQLGFETLETRNLMEAAGFEAASLMSHQANHSVSTVQTSQGSSTPTARIVNGVQTSGFPAVGLVGDGCTGTLISPTHVLTAAHCVEGITTTGTSFTVGGRTYNSVRVTTHPDYNPNDFSAGDDLAIIELDRPVTNVTPMEINRTTPQIGTMLTLVGFGEGGTSTGGFDPNDEGKQVGQTELEGVTSEHITWNFDSHSEANTAPGDSGGPAFITVGGRQVIAGVTSGGSGEAQSLGDNSFDTRIDVHAAWIDQIVGSTTPAPTPEPGPSDPGPATPADPSDDHADRPVAGATKIVLNQNGQGSSSGNIESEGDRDAFQFTVAQSGQTTISLSGRDLDTYLRIYNQNGTLVAENDDIGDSLNSRVTENLSAGTYFIVAGTYEDSEFGRFNISVNHQASEPTPTPGRVFTNTLDRQIADAGISTPWGVSWVSVSGMTGSVSDVNVTVDIEHQKISDLRLILISPNKQRIVLENRQGGNGTRFVATTFDQQARPHINHGSGNYSGSFRPVMSLDALNGTQPNGTWLLVAVDYARGNVGTIKNFQLELKTTAGRQNVARADFDTARQPVENTNEATRNRNRLRHANASGNRVADTTYSRGSVVENRNVAANDTSRQRRVERRQFVGSAQRAASPLAVVDRAFAQYEG